MLIVEKYPELYTFIQDNRQSLIDYLTTSIPRDSLINWSKNHHIVILDSSELDYLLLEIKIVTLSYTDYNNYLKNEYPYSYQRHFGIRPNGQIYDSQTGQYPSVIDKGGKNISHYILEYWKSEKRNIKLKQIL